MWNINKYVFVFQMFGGHYYHQSFICDMLNAQEYCNWWTEWIQIDESNCTIKCMNVNFPHTSLHLLATASLGHWWHWGCCRFCLHFCQSYYVSFSRLDLRLSSVTKFSSHHSTVCCHLNWHQRTCPIFPYVSFFWIVYFSLKTI